MVASEHNITNTVDSVLGLVILDERVNEPARRSIVPLNSVVANAGSQAV